jgi:hypothetical protein
MFRFVIVIAAVLACVAGCASPCQKLAERTCANAGAESPACKSMRDVATRNNADDRRSCEGALTFLSALDRSR